MIIMEELFIIKVGGNIIDDDEKLGNFLRLFSTVKGNKILVHGGGKLATRIGEALSIPQQMFEGRRITDAETLKVVTMVYAGYINKNIVASLFALHTPSIGICGADANIVLAHKRRNAQIDYGFAGDVDEVNAAGIKAFLDQQLCVVVAPITHDGNGQLLNTNADTIAQEIAKAMSESFSTTLIYSFEKEGVLLDAEDESTLISTIEPVYFQQLKAEKKIFAGMIPKLENAFKAIEKGVGKVIIGRAEKLHALIEGKTGTTIIAEKAQR